MAPCTLWMTCRHQSIKHRKALKAMEHTAYRIIFFVTMNIFRI